MNPVAQIALLAGASYRSSRAEINRLPIPAGWQEVPLSHVVLPSGFEAVSFRNSVSGDVVVAFAGTSDLVDWVANFGLGSGVGSDQLREAAAYYLEIKAANPTAEISFTGHSLGGGLAALMGVFFNRRAITFDQAPFANSATTAIRDDLVNYLTSSGYSAAYLTSNAPELLAFNSAQQRASNVIGWHVAGEALSLKIVEFLLSRIGGEVSIDHGTTDTSLAIALHSQALLSAFQLNESFRKVTFALPDLLRLASDSALYRRDTGLANSTDENFIERLLRHEVGVRDPITGVVSISADKMLERFTADLQRVAREGGLTLADGNLTKALIAFAMQMYYEKPTAGDKTLFREVAGGIRFDRNDVANTLAGVKGYTLYFMNYLATLPTAERDLIAQQLPQQRDWFIQAGRGGMHAEADTQRAFMLGGGQADVLIGSATDDLIVAGAGADHLLGGKGDDLLMGGPGNDLYMYRTGDGNDRIVDEDRSGRIIIDDVDRVSLLAGGIFVRTPGLNEWTSPDRAITLAHDSPWKIVLPDGSEIDLGDTLNSGDFGIRLKDAPVVPTPTYTLTGDFELLDDDSSTPGIQPVGDGFGNYVRDANVAFPDRADLFYGRESGDLIDPRGGDDRVYAKGGADWVKAGSGRDFVDAGAGDDLVETGADSDIGIGGAGSDQLFAQERIDIAAAIAAGRSGSGSGQKGDWLTGGRGDDIVIGGAGDDVLFGGGEEDLIVGGAGDDTIDGDDDYIAMSFDWSVTPLSGNVYDAFYQPINVVDYSPDVGGSDTIYAGAGNDRVFGLQGDDIVYGEGGEDTIAGDDGDDMLFGGEDSDRITGDYGRYAYAANGARIAQGDDYLDGGAGNDFLYGDGGRDILFGGAGIDYLDGDAEYLDTADQGDDTLDGGADADVLFGRGGRDMLLGGAGDDLLFGGAHGDTIDGGAGADYAEGGEGNDTLLGGADGDTLYGDGGADSLDGGAGDDRLYGGEGEDTLVGGAGADQFVGGAGKDRFADARIIDGDAILDVERSEVVALADVGAAAGLNATSAIRDGAAGVLIKADAADTTGLFVQGGLMQLEALDPTFELGDGTRISHSALMDQVFTADVTLLGTPLGDLLKGYAGNDTLQGLAGDDRLVGGAGADLLEGGEGNDELIGGAGIDTLRGDAGDDTYTIDASDFVDEAPGAGFDTVVANFSATLGESLEALRLAGSEALDATGNAEPNTLVGNDAANVLAGLGGDDTLLGNGGNDTLTGGIGDDYLAGGAGDDTYFLSPGDGSDTLEDDAGVNVVRFGAGIGVSSLAADTYLGDDGATYLAVAYGDRGDALAIRDGLLGAVSEYRFADGAVLAHRDLLDTLGPLAIDGSAAHETIAGANAADTIDGRGGDDVIYGGGAGDVLIGGAGDDRLYGEAGGDTLDGGPGNDLLAGGAGEDSYVLAWGTGADRIEEDGLDASHLRLGPAIGFDDIVATRDGNDLTLALRGVASSAITLADYFVSAGAWDLTSASGATRLLADVLAASPSAPADPIAAAIAAFEARIKAEYFASLGAAGFAGDGADEFRSAFTVASERGVHTTYSSYAVRTVQQASDASFIQRISAPFESETHTQWSASELRVVAPSPGARGVANALAQTDSGWRFVPASAIAPAITMSATGIAVSRAGGDYSALQPSSLQGFWVPDASGPVEVPTLPVPVQNVVRITSSVTYESARLNIEAIRGGAESNSIWTGDYSVVDGGAGADFISVYGDPGYALADTSRGYGRLGSLLYGNEGDDSLAGGAGNDILIGGAGDDTLSGGAGADTYARVGEGSDSITDTGDDLDRYRQSYFDVANFSDLEVREAGGGRFLDTVAFAEIGLGNSEVSPFFASPQAGLEWVLRDLEESLATVRDAYASLLGWDGTGVPPTYNGQTAQDLRKEIERYEAQIAWEVSRHLERFVYVEPLPPLPVIAGNDHAAIEPYYGSAVWVDRVALAEKWRPDTLVVSTSEAGGEPGFLHLDHPDGDRVTIALARAADPIGTGVEVIDFADGTELTIRQVLARATATGNLVGADGYDELLGGTGPEVLAGRGGDDYLAGGGGNDTLLGGPGVDTLRGGAGDDTYYVSTGDTVTERAHEGIDVVYAGVSWTLGRNLEHLTLTGSADIDATGNGLANVLTGNSGDNWLDGKGGADTMAGGAGDDTYVVAQTADVVIESAGAGLDTVRSSVGYTLGEHLEHLTLTGTKAIHGTGNALANVLTGNNAHNKLTGGAGDDRLAGLAGADTLVGGLGNDTYLLGLGDGADTIVENDSTLGNSDRALFLGGVANDQIWLRRVGNNLEASIIGTSDAFVLRDWYRGAAYRVERFQTIDGDKTLLEANVQALVDAMAAFAPPAPGITTLPLDYQTALNPAIAANWQ